MATAHPDNSARRRFSVWLPPPRWAALATIVLVASAEGMLLVGKYRREQAAIELIKSGGGKVFVKPRGPDWLRSRLGDDRMRIFDPVVEVDLRNFEVSKADSVTTTELDSLKWLTDLEELSLDSSEVTDDCLAQLSGMTKLEWLWIRQPAVADSGVTEEGLERLQALSNLKWLFLEGNGVWTVACLGKLGVLTNLKGLCLYTGMDVTDAGLAPLKGLTKLRVLFLDAPGVTDAGLVHLKGLTDLEILFLNDSAVTPTAWKRLTDGLPKLKFSWPGPTRGESWGLCRNKAFHEARERWVSVNPRHRRSL